VHGALAFISMPGLVAVTVGFFLAGGGILALGAGLALLAASAVRRELRPAGAGTAAGGILLGLAGVATALLGDRARDGDLADAAALVAAPVLAGLALWAGVRVGRAVQARAAPAAPGR
jgi:hypothetical protein